MEVEIKFRVKNGVWRSIHHRCAILDIHRPPQELDPLAHTPSWEPGPNLYITLKDLKS